MKRIYLLASILFSSFINLNAQVITIRGACIAAVDGDYELSSNINGRPSYTSTIFIIQWTGERWEHNPIENTRDVGMYNDSDTENPPASSFSPWISELCDPAGDFTGEGTSSPTLSITEEEFTEDKIALYPNPANEFISISGLEKEIDFKIYDSSGVEIKTGKNSSNEKNDIENLASGLYFMKVSDKNVLKFIKE